MNDELAKIQQVKAQREALYKELSELQNKLKKTIKQLERQILNGFESSSYESEIVRLRTKIEGTEKAIKSLDAFLNQSNEEDALRQRKEKFEKVKQLRAECLELLAGTYLLFAEGISQMKALEEKRKEYYLLAKGMEKEGDLLRKVSNLLYYSKTRFSELLTSFPSEMYMDEKLPKPEELIRSLPRR